MSNSPCLNSKNTFTGLMNPNVKRSKMIFSFKSNITNDYKRKIFFKKMRILEAIIPFSFYNINSTNNTFIFNDGVADRTVTLTPGQYDYITFPTEIQTKMNTFGILTFTVVYNPNTKNLTITETSGPTNFDLKFVSTDEICDFIGFLRQTYTGVSTYTAPYITNFRPYNYIGMKLDNFQPSKNTIYDFYSINNVSTVEGFLSVFPLYNVKFGENLIYNDLSIYNNIFWQNKALFTEKLNFKLYLISSNSFLVSQNGAVNSIVVEYFD